MRHRAKAWLGRGLIASRLHRFVLGTDGIIVTFHRVNDDLPPDELTRTSRDFERFCRFFRTYFDVVSLDYMVTRIVGGASIGGTLAITFDDGYRDNFEVAAPILRKLGLPATFFVVTRYLDTATVPWWDAKLPHQPGWMTWDQARMLAREGFDIGGHTRTHVDLGNVTGDRHSSTVGHSEPQPGAPHLAVTSSSLENLWIAKDVHRQVISRRFCRGTGVGSNT